MIAAIKGEIFEIQEDCFIVMAGGIGYRVYTPVQNYQPLPMVGEEVLLYTYYYLREDAAMLFGFETKKELALFNLLLGVNGVGAKTALAMLNSQGYAELIRAIQMGVATNLTKIPGIGKKTAERILLELRDKVMKLEPAVILEVEPEAQTSSQPTDDLYDTAIAALAQLGYSASLAGKYVKEAQALLGQDASLETMITAALRIAANG